MGKMETTQSEYEDKIFHYVTQYCTLTLMQKNKQHNNNVTK